MIELDSELIVRGQRRRQPTPDLPLDSIAHALGPAVDWVLAHLWTARSTLRRPLRHAPRRHPRPKQAIISPLDEKIRAHPTMK